MHRAFLNKLSFVKDVFLLMGFPVFGVFIFYFYTTQVDSLKEQIELYKAKSEFMQRQLSDTEKLKYDKAYTLIDSLKKLHNEELVLVKSNEQELQEKVNSFTNMEKDYFYRELVKKGTFLNFVDILDSYGVDEDAIEEVTWMWENNNMDVEGLDAVSVKLALLVNRKKEVEANRREILKSERKILESKLELLESKNEMLQLESTMSKWLMVKNQKARCEKDAESEFCKAFESSYEEYFSRVDKIDDETKAEYCLTISSYLTHRMCPELGMEFKPLN